MKRTTLAREQYEIAYNRATGKSPCVIFCGGFNSHMQGSKAMALERYCIDKGQAFIRFDYQGHGESGGEFADGSISTWLADTLAVMDELAGEDIVLVGSSMGGWLSLLAALRRKEQVKSLILLACAVDMTRYYPERIKRDAKNREFYQVKNQYNNQEPYNIYQRLIDDGEQHFLLDHPIELNMPIHLIHGQQDDVVPWQRSQQLVDRLTSAETSLHFVKHGDHRLSTRNDIQLLASILDLLL